MRESLIEKYLVAQVKAKGGEVRKVRFLDRRGAPDRLVLFAGGVAIWVELKATGKKPEPHQVREHARLRKSGQRVDVVDSLEAVGELLKQC